MKTSTIVRADARAGLLVSMLAFLILTLLLETVLASPVKLPGHRALPGAMTILLFAEVFTPVFLVGFALAVPAVLAAAGFADPVMILGWLVPALLLVLLGRTRLRQSVLYFLLVGLAFGLARYLLMLPGMHRTPEILRLGGHVAFGALGGLAAHGIRRTCR